MRTTTTTGLGTNRTALLVLTLMLSGRAMTLAIIGDAGSGGVGDPPAAWLMPLIGDTAIGLSALPIAYLVWNGRGLSAWTAIVAWNTLGIWDALSAFLVHQSVPWPEFFMIEIFGPSMFFAASAMHFVNLWLVSRDGIRKAFLGEAIPGPHGAQLRPEPLRNDG